MRAAEGHGGGKCRAGWGKRREVGLERWNEGRIGGIGVVFVGDGRPGEEMCGQFWTSVRHRGLALTSSVEGSLGGCRFSERAE